jgi:hypothetical protein
MKLKFSAFAWFLLGCFNLVAQDPGAQQYGNLITPADLKEYLSILASDAMEGRETGKRGQKMAAAFISAHFQEIGLSAPVDGSHYQPVDLFTSMPGEIYIKAGQTQYKNFEDLIYYGSAESNGEVSLPVVFAGKGRKEDFDQISAEGKAVLIHLGTGENFRGPSTLAREKGAKMILFFHPDAAESKKLIAQFGSYLSGGSLSLTKPEPKNGGVFFVSPDLAMKLIGSDMEKVNKAIAAEASKAPLKKMKPGAVIYKTSMTVRNKTIRECIGIPGRLR